ncbi:MAG: transcriptional repressor [Proteobacteria bacterium]|nr:transcriptional repressor [Pseudomonadota bacterium]
MRAHPPVTCIDPKHHVHHADDFVREVARACDERGLRLTPLRADVLRLVADAGRPVKAYDLLSQISESKAASAPPTIYRALDFLLDNGFIHKLESINAFVACHHPNVRHTVPFLICDGCQSAIEMEDEKIGRQLDEKARALGFTPQAQTLEVHGMCAACAGAGDSTHR